MGIPDDVVKAAWERAAGQCECMKQTHSHFYRPCSKPLVWKNRGQMVQGGWEAYSRIGSQPADCQILCWSCYEAMR